MITRYRIISMSNIHTLVEEIGKAIKDGWKPLGGVAVTLDAGCTVVMQALIMEDDK